MARAARIALLLVVAFLVPAAMAAAQSSARRGAPQQPGLMVTSNVLGATVFVNNTMIGTTPVSRNLNPGNYTVVVQATGYQEYRASVNVNASGQVTVNAYLQPINYHVTIHANVQGANVFINGQRVGQTPYTVVLQPGNYHVRVASPGYQEFSTRLTVNQNMSIHARLEARVAVLHFQIPGQYLNHHGDFRGGDNRRARDAIHVFVDNRPIHNDRVEVHQGNHSIRFESGGLEVEQSFYFQAGQSYTISPQLSINVQ